MVDNVVDGGSKYPIENIDGMSSDHDQIGLCFDRNGEHRVGGATGANMDKRWH